MKNTNRDNGLFKGVDISVFAVSAGFMLAFVGLAIVDMDWLGALVRAGATLVTCVFCCRTGIGRGANRTVSAGWQ
jgi:hypothetical protein